VFTERLLQFIWQFQYFNKSGLTTTTGEKMQIISAGQLNSNQGPDFSDAKIKIGNTTWAGNVELHIKTSDWNKHKHDTDSNYNNVILHVVWEDDEKSAPPIPALQIKERTSKILLQRYHDLMNANGFIPCENSIHTVPEIVWKSWKERLLVERLARKSKTVENYLGQSHFHWEETFWWLLARNFGVSVNSDAFEAMARTIPLNLLSKHKTQIHQLEGLLFGQAGLLNSDFDEDYPSMLKKEWLFYKNKYSLAPVNNPVFFLRMRPGNFPTVRLAQLAILIQDSAHLFSNIKDAISVHEVKKWFDVTANDYWHYHYKFDELSEYKPKKLGSSTIENIIINTITPMLFAYGSYHAEERFRQKALRWLEEISPEINFITKGYQKWGVENKTAFDSQALIELKNEYCNKKRCLDCAVGNSILKISEKISTRPPVKNKTSEEHLSLFEKTGDLPNLNIEN
jgi:hypothetical protein